jgi:hypothetical protein
MKNPARFEGKLVKVRAQLWTDVHQYWLTESVASSLRFNAFCGWLPAKFSNPTSLVASRAFGTFTGRIVRESDSSSKLLQFLIEGQTDIYRQELVNGPIVLRLYDQSVDAFVRPEQRISPVPGFKLPRASSRPLCYEPPSLVEGVAPATQLPVSGPPMMCGYICDGGVPVRVCTKG